MSGADYRIRLYASDGATEIGVVTRRLITALEYTQRVNDTGYFRVEFPAKHLTRPMYEELAVDSRIVVERKPEGTNRWGIDFAGVGRFVELALHGQELYVDLRGYHYNELLNRRIVDAPAADADATASGGAADAIKRVVREQLGASAVTARDLTGAGFTVQADISGYGGTSVEKAFSRRNVLSVCQELAEASKSTLATAAFFGYVPTGIGVTAEFRTRLGSWGEDVSSAITFSVENGNLLNPRYSIDRRDEVTYVLGAGSGLQEERVEATDLADTARIGESPLNRRESFYDLRNEGDAAVIASAMEDMLYDGRPRRLLAFDAIDTRLARYGIHYGLGYVVRGSFAGIVRDYHVASVQVRVQGRETVTPILEELYGSRR